MGNKYVLILLIFTIWMVFFDTNSWFIHKELNDEIDKLEGNRAYFKQEIKNDREQINKLKDSEELERFAREEYYMKKDKEEIFIIEYEDSLKTEENDG
ncbi:MULTISPECIES: FtsB family cell division protein [unclassified Leeuwenhoekiella]|uniref:FtsB family cell division protein n=1 Tax=unclassified Leeuwenhoekiella TaxID=2615029 RepID=UPI00068D943B|nr:septum formation initiator family protein [Leeuwenhoekiella sp. MAR_2009_132]